MTKFVVHYIIGGTACKFTIEAATPDDAANKCRKEIKGAIVSKVKVKRDER